MLWKQGVVGQQADAVIAGTASVSQMQPAALEVPHTPLLLGYHTCSMHVLAG